jgi:hypothetical protein
MFERIKAGVKKLADNLKQQQKDGSELADWQAKFNSARDGYQTKLDLMDEREMLYLGTSKVDMNVNAKSVPKDGVKKANNVRNVIFEFIETQADSAIPQPLITAKSPENEGLAKAIEDSLKADILDLHIERHNDQQERTCPIQGHSLFEILWNTNKRTHTYIGGIDVRLIHPKQFVPYPGVWEIQQMPYFFIMSSVTKQFIKDRYDVDVSEETESDPQINSLKDIGASNKASDKVTEKVCWYKDDDGDIGRYVWCNDIKLESLPKIFKRKQEGKDVETFTLDTDYTDANGQPIIPKGTVLPYFTPDRYPIVLRENVPIPFDFGGQSDVDVIRDQQDAIKKVISRIEEKILSTTSVVTYPDSLKGKFSLTNAAVTGVPIKPNEANLFSASNLAPNVSQDREFAQDQYNIAQSTLGITDALQGKPDASARSGTAKQIQIAQSTGRLKSKQANKIQAYRELFEIMFQFKLAYSDEPRPYVTKGQSGEPAYGDFNKLAFLKQDAAKEWYYDTDFIFNADANGGLPSDRNWQLGQNTQLLQYGAFGNPQDPQAMLRFWTTMVEIHYPGAEMVKKSFQDAVAQAQQAQQQMAQQAAQMQSAQGTQPQQSQQIGGMQ